MVYDNVKKIASERGLPICEVEKSAGLGNGVIGAWRKSDPQISSVLKVAKALDVSIEDLIKEETENANDGDGKD